MADTTREKANGTPRAARADEGEARAVTLAPRVDILETDDEFLLLADLPGVRPEDVDIRFENGELAVHGRRTAGGSDVASYFRTFRLSEQIAADRVEAGLKNGVLTVHLPKVEAVKPRRIAVKG